MANQMDEIITESVEDAFTPDTGADFDTNTDTSTQDTSETSQEASGTDSTSSEASTSGQTPEASQTGLEAPADEFSRKFGIPTQSALGRENRIPYGRVKAIVTKNERDVTARVTKELETKFQPQLTEYQTKVQDYEGRLQKVAQFEHILENDPQQFLGMLAQLPSYKPFFDHINSLAAGTPQQAPQAYLDSSAMPQPDQELSDGSRVYSLDGLAKRDEWLAKQIESKVLKQAEDRLTQRYAPMEQEWQSNQRMQQMVPVVERQISEARKWDKFTELEPRVIDMLKADRSVSLEGAYIRAYQEAVAAEREHLTADRNKVRGEVLEEIKRRPVASTSVPVGAVRANPQTQQGPRDTEDVIRESLRNAGLIA
jgi:hypothetical protein